MLVTINDLQARATNEQELDNTIKLLVSANIGSWGWDKWGDNGMWIKHNEVWDAKASFNITESTLKLPFKVVDDIYRVTVIDGTVPLVSCVYYIYNDNTIDVSAFIGKRVIIELNLIKNVRN